MQSGKENIGISHIPVILLTARNDEQSRLYGYKIGADAYLGKPFEIDTLVKIIQNRLYNREQTKEHYQHIGNFLNRWRVLSARRMKRSC